MSVIAWDGKMLAADRMAVSFDLAVPVCKIERLGNEVLAWTGTQEHGLLLLVWYRNGAKPAEWPAFQRTDDWTRLVIASANGVRFYEREPIPQTVSSKRAAWGSGRDFALGAMEMGATAYQAIITASSFSINCGCGVDAYEFCPDPRYRGSSTDGMEAARE